MNIYLDIDGVLLANDKYHANFAPEFIEYCLTNYPDSTYWLTTHCKGDAGRPIRNIGHLFDAETVELMKKIKSTNWGSAKTDAIDFSVPFLWFDDDLFAYEREVLIKNGVLDNWIEVDLMKDENALGKFLQSFPMPINSFKK